ncbi:MAG: tRNA methyl transferase PRC-barrel domain-containing protein [Balneolaceae bacterium]|nr:tRNA methyl transferase PRC-barrel domain-containing protein [Balneolaceae bacterium]
MGEHEGYPFYTIGQRRGLDLALGKRVYVTDIDPETNVITVGEKKDLVSTTCVARDINLMKYDRVPEDGMEITGAIRYNDDGAVGYLAQTGERRDGGLFPRRARGHHTRTGRGLLRRRRPAGRRLDQEGERGHRRAPGGLREQGPTPQQSLTR